MLAKIESACLIGMEAAQVHVEVNLSKGLPYFSIVGLPDASVREAKDRVVAAIRNSGFEFPSRRVTVNLAPADLKKEGAFFDLAIAIGVLMASEAIQPEKWPRCIWLGELALDGMIRPIRGALPLIMGLSQKGWKEFILPEANVPEIQFLKGIRPHPFTRLNETLEWLKGTRPASKVISHPLWEGQPSSGIDFSDIKGQAAGKRALEIAAAGGHHILFSGCPGTGKSLLAQALPSIMPSWSLDEALDASQIHSISGQLNGSGLLPARPFRSPHHSISCAALIGGGDTPLPGELSLAHRGVLFLDELPEFRRDALEALRQPLEESVVHIRRVRGRASYPAACLVVAAMNPCPCGYRGHPKKECLCSPQRIQKYIAKVSGPVMERIDLQVEIPSLKTEELFAEGPLPEPSETVRLRVMRARKLQLKRYADYGAQFTNASLRGKALKRYCGLQDDGKNLLKTAVERLGLSARAFDRIQKVARSIADLDEVPQIQAKHLAEAIQFRAFDKPPSSFQ
jgi:magnesium chelatase family protein